MAGLDHRRTTNVHVRTTLVWAGARSKRDVARGVRPAAVSQREQETIYLEPALKGGQELRTRRDEVIQGEACVHNRASCWTGEGGGRFRKCSQQLAPDPAPSSKGGRPASSPPSAPRWLNRPTCEPALIRAFHPLVDLTHHSAPHRPHPPSAALPNIRGISGGGISARRW